MGSQVMPFWRHVITAPRPERSIVGGAGGYRGLLGRSGAAAVGTHLLLGPPPAALERRSGQPDVGANDLNERTAKIPAEIEPTREEMTETIEVQEKLRQSRIVANAGERLKQATAERVRSMADEASDTANGMIDHGRGAYRSVAGEIRRNAIPIAMIGIGAAWLLLGHNKGGRGTWRDASGGDRPSHRGGDGGAIVSTLTTHPFPAALAAIGIAWLAFSERRASSQHGGWTGAGWTSSEQWRRQFREAQRQGVGYTGTNTGSGGSNY